jgi:hypothetical protein
MAFEDVSADYSSSIASSEIPTQIPSHRHIFKVEQHHLGWLPGSKQKLRDKIEMTAISPTGRKVALLSKRKFWVFNTRPVTLICVGEFIKGGTIFQYASGDRRLETQHPIINVNVSTFSAVALSDRYLAIAAPGRVMVFIIENEFSGRWVVSYQTTYDQRASIERMAFSGDGEQLLALLRAAIGHSSQVRSLTFHSGLFPKEKIGRNEPDRPQIQEVIFENDWDLYRPTGVAFSLEGTLAAICTSHSGYRAGIQLLRRADTGLWSALGALEEDRCFSE